MIYEIINPSDKITFVADDERIAIAVTVLLGEGKYGLRGEDSAKQYPTMVSFMDQNQINEALKPYFDDGVNGLMNYTVSHAKEMATAFDTVATVGREFRVDYETALQGITDESKRSAYKRDFNDRHRSSMNDIYGYAKEWKEHFMNISETHGVTQ